MVLFDIIYQVDLEIGILSYVIDFGVVLEFGQVGIGILGLEIIGGILFVMFCNLGLVFGKYNLVIGE